MPHHGSARPPGRWLTRRGKEFAAFATLNVLIGVAQWIALGGIDTSQVPLPTDGHPSPLGYFRSLILFALPCLVFGLWLARARYERTRARAFLVTVGALFPVGVLMDVFFGRYFFTFPNEAAVIGSVLPIFRLPAFNWSEGWAGLTGSGWIPGYIPIEEVLFYGLGFASILLTYIWCEEAMFGDENSDPAQPVPGVFRRWPMAAGTCFLAGALLFGIAYLICVAVRGDEPMFPAYFLFLLVSAVLPSMFCFHVAFHFVHWRALTVSWLFTLSVSQFWEASLGLPYQWWDYNRSAMMGIFIRPHCDLPIEAMIVWTLASWTTVIVYETVLSLLRLRQERGLRGALRLLRGLPDDLDEAKRLESARPRSAR